MMKIEKLYAWIATEKDGSEGIPAIMAGNGMILPLVGADMERIESFREHAESTGLPTKLVCFDNMTILETINQ